jgi:hypothetical protein
MTTGSSFHTLSISRRNFIGLAALAAGTLGAASATAGAKFSQSMAKYQPSPKNGQSCKTCTQFQTPDACKVVEGKISPNGWCLLYTH